MMIIDKHDYFRFKPAALIRVSGEDAPDYLQSQFTNDLSRSEPGKVTYGLWLDRKGKVAADSFVFHLGEEEYLLLSYFCPAAEIMAKLESNIIADEVELEDVTEGAVLAVAFGCEAGALPVKGSFLKESSGQAEVLGFAGRLGAASHEVLWLEQAPEAALALPEVDEETLRFARIEACIPAVPEDIGAGDLPQEGGLEKDAVSFTKGCYLGQEVMARLHAMGKTTRVLHQVELESLPGEALPVAITYDEGKSAGELRSVAACEGRVLGLAMLKRRALDAGSDLLLNSASQIRVLKSLA